MTVGLISYGAGNTRSVMNALERIGCTVVVSDSPDMLGRADKVIFPGVGEARSAMAFVRDRHLDTWIRSSSRPFLGICLGMQVCFDRSTERDTECLGIVPGTVSRFGNVKVPHMGWNAVDHADDDPLFEGIPTGSYFYFAHSFFAPVTDVCTARTTYGTTFSSAIRTNNLRGVQFHPEKSGDAGMRLLTNFVERC